MTENQTPAVEAGEKRGRLRSAALAVSAVGVVALAGTAVSQWSDSAEVEGPVEVGHFEITIDEAELDFEDADNFVYGVAQTSAGHTVTNASTVASDMALSFDGFGTEGAWDLTVTYDGEAVFTGDPADGLTGLDLGTLGVEEAADIEFELELVDTDPGLFEESATPGFTFTGTQVDPTAGDGEEG